MDSKKFMLGGLLGSVVNFFLGWLVWGMLLMGFIQKHSNPSASVIFRSDEKMVWWAMIAGNLAAGFLVCYILTKANIKTAGGGAFTGAVVGMLSALAVDCMMYAQMMIYGLPALVVDIAAATVVTGIVAAVVGWFLGRGNAS